MALGYYTPEETRTTWSEPLKLMLSSGARPQIDCVFPLRISRKPLNASEGPMGKVLIRVSP